MKGKSETETPVTTAPSPSADDSPKSGLNGQQQPAAAPDAPVMPTRRTVIGCRLSPQALQLAVNVLKAQPWEIVADFMPALIQAKPLFEDEMYEYQCKLAESE